KPVLAVATIKEILQRTDADTEHDETDHVEWPGLTMRARGHEIPGHQVRQNADWHVDEETPAPTVILGDVAAEGWPQYRPDQNAEGENRHRRAMAFTRIGIQQDRLRQR